MIGNISAHYSHHSQARVPGSAVSRSSAQVLLQTAAALSMASPRRIATGRRSQRRTAVPVSAPTALPVDRRQQGHKGRRSGVRLRESARAAEPVRHPGQESETPGLAAKGSKSKKGKAGARQEPRPAGGRTGSTPGPAHSRQRRHHASVWGDYVPLCQKQQAVPVYQHNFTAIGDAPDACYRLAEDIDLQGNQTQGLPIGNRTHPFRASLDSDGHTLSVQLTRTQGDAVLFDRIEHSELRLSVVDSHLETGNGSRAALIGTMGGDNRVIISRLQGSLFRATGEGTVEAGLVAHSRRGDNWLELNKATDNLVEARALPPSGHCSDPCQHRASVSLGVGTLWAEEGRPDSLFGWQRIWQRDISDNQLLAWAGGESRSEQNKVPAQAAAGVLGILGDRSGRGERLSSVQERLYSNRIEARVAGGPGIEAGTSHASPGYACAGCDQYPVSLSTQDEWLWTVQAGFRNNSVQALSDGPRLQGAAFEAVARTNLVSTSPVYFLWLHQRALEPGQLQARAEGSSSPRGPVAERALVPVAADDLRLFLFSDGDASLPLFAGNDTDLAGVTADPALHRGLISQFGQIDQAGYLRAPFDASQAVIADLLKEVTVSSLEPRGWRQAVDRLRSSVASFGNLLACGARGTSLHYPHEELQSLASYSGRWFLLTRQRYPFHPDNDRQGLIRLSSYRLPEDGKGRPLADAGNGAVALYQPRQEDVVLQDRAVSGLVQLNAVFGLHQDEGQPAQLVMLSRHDSNGHYQLAQYEDLAGQARLLSNERGELHLWTQTANNVLMVYGLGSHPDSNSSWLHWGFDLSEQPGGPLLLARSFDWLYSLRQEDGQPASLRRWHLRWWSAPYLDRDWQPVWPGNVTASQRLVAANGYLTAVPPGALPDPRQPGTGWQARVPDEGGCLQWERITLASYPLPARPPWSTMAAPDRRPFSTLAVSPGSASAVPATVDREPSDQEAGQRFFSLTWFGVGAGVFFLPVAAVGTVIFLGTCAAFTHRRREATVVRVNPPRPLAQEPPRPMPACVRQPPIQETAM